MAIIQGNAKQGSTRGFYPKVINGSLRFNDDDGAYLSWTPASAGNRKTWTWSGWVKRSELVSGNLSGALFSWKTGTAFGYLAFYFDGLRMYDSNAGYLYQTNAVYRDTSAWYHIVLSVDTTQGTPSNRVRLYVNGGEVTSFSTETNPSQNADTNCNNNIQHTIGLEQNDSDYFDGYLANVHFIDGQALTADDFGETKNGVWVAKDYAGTFGTNGFYLTFEDDTQVEAFNTVLWRGVDVENTGITGVGFQPDLVWLKSRTNTATARIVDSVRGVTAELKPSTTDAEGTTTTGITSFDSDGFTVSTNNAYNGLGESFVAWCWKAGDSNVSNTDGTITSTVRANDTYGFSIIDLNTPASGSFTVGHGLSSAPDFIILKRRDAGLSNWVVGHTSMGWDKYMFLQSTGGQSSSTTAWSNTAPTSSVINLDSSFYGGSANYICYCWSETTGYSKFGSWTGDGTSDGSKTVDFGFKPALIIFKRTDTAGYGWNILDNTRDTANPIGKGLQANTSNAENTSDLLTFTDTGIQFTETAYAGTNASGGTYIYAAFADTREAAFWLDQSGNDNDWQPVNLDHNDTVADSPTNNFATLNPLDEQGSANTLLDGNLVVNMAAAGSLEQTRATMGISSGQFYWEAEVLSSGSNGGYFRVGFKSPDHHAQGLSTSGAYWMVRGADGETEYMINNSGTQGASDVRYSVGDIIMVAVDMDAGKWWVGANGTWVGDPVAGTGAIHDNLYGTVIPFVSNATSAATHVGRVNFGQQPFKYDPPA